MPYFRHSKQFLMLRFCLYGSTSCTAERSMSRFYSFLWPRPHAIRSYGIAVLSVIAALILSRWPALHLEAAPVSLFLCPVILSAWFGGVGPRTQYDGAKKE